MLFKVLLLLLLLILPIFVGNIAVAQAPRSLMDVPYVEAGSVHQKLDLYVPSNVVSPSLVLYIHGGGWLSGDKSDVPQFLLKSGYAVATINTRPISVARHPAQIEDCISALHWLQQNAKRFGYSADSIAVVGVSSGGHLASLLGTMQYPGRQAVKCVIDVSGPVNLASIHSQAKLPAQQFFAGDQGQIAGLIGGPPAKNRAAALAASPVSLVSASSSPFLIIHGANDEVVPVQQAAEFHQQLDAAGVRNELVILPNSMHGLSTEVWSVPFLAFVSKFLPPPQKMRMDYSQYGQSAPWGDAGFRHHRHNRDYFR